MQAVAYLALFSSLPAPPGPTVTFPFSSLGLYTVAQLSICADPHLPRRAPPLPKAVMQTRLAPLSRKMTSGSRWQRWKRRCATWWELFLLVCVCRAAHVPA